METLPGRPILVITLKPDFFDRMDRMGGMGERIGFDCNEFTPTYRLTRNPSCKILFILSSAPLAATSHAV